MFIFIAAVLIVGVAADVYMQNPRGSNNRLNEGSAARAYHNRLFDSQNNDRGGYNVGDRSLTAFDPANPVMADDNALFDMTADPEAKVQYPMMFFEGSVLPVEWTSQHGCGGNEASDPYKLNCNMVIQYTCTMSNNDVASLNVNLKDGGNVERPDATDQATNIGEKTTANNNNRRGRHESESWYHECTARPRNQGLFTADQCTGDEGKSSIVTRQNNLGDRYGLECPEERDYYPYWMPTPWKDIAYLTDRTEMFCDANGKFTGASQNNKEVFRCVSPNTDERKNEQQAPANQAYVKAVTQEACNKTGGVWKGYSWGLPAPECRQADWSRVNHLGNGKNAQPITYNWTLPTIREATTDPNASFAKCVLRVRYNISTDDFDPWTTDSTSNHKNDLPNSSPVTNNPTVDIGINQGLRLAVNTAQFGRTFQDRSHVFFIKKKPAAFANRKVYNLNVRGKRGNIVQTFPATEYDFTPSRLHVRKSDLVHVQWTGSNTHHNGHTAGDGQAGDAGEGKGGTDRHNMVQIGQTSSGYTAGDFSYNYPLPLDKFPDNLFTRSKCYYANGTAVGSPIDCAILMGTSGYIQSRSQVTSATKTVDVLLNNAPASLVGGILLDFSTTADAVASVTEKQNSVSSSTSFDYICTRNNNFSNRGQKATLIVDP